MPKGLRQKDGKELVLTAYESLPQPQNKETLQLVAQQWGKLGVKLNVLAGDAGSRVARQPRSGEDAGRAGHGRDAPIPT